MLLHQPRAGRFLVCQAFTLCAPHNARNWPVPAVISQICCLHGDRPLRLMLDTCTASTTHPGSTLQSRGYLRTRPCLMAGSRTSWTTGQPLSRSGSPRSPVRALVDTTSCFGVLGSLQGPDTARPAVQFHKVGDCDVVSRQATWHHVSTHPGALQEAHIERGWTTSAWHDSVIPLWCCQKVELHKGARMNDLMLLAQEVCTVCRSYWVRYVEVALLRQLANGNRGIEPAVHRQRLAVVSSWRSRTYRCRRKRAKGGVVFASQGRTWPVNRAGICTRLSSAY